MKHIINIFILFFICSFVYAQDTVDIWQCLRMAEINHPLYAQKEINKGITGYELANISRSWFPDISVNGQAAYQSDVVGFGTFTAPHDQYKLYLEVNQQLYDGGIAAKRKEIEHSNLEINQQQLEVEFHKIRQQVSSVYFSIVLLKKNTEILRISRSELNERLKTIRAAIENGALLPENEFILRAELLKLEMQEDELYHKTEAAIETLNRLTGLKTMPQGEFDVPFSVQLQDSIPERPERAMFGLQKALIENNIELLKTINRPKLFAFAQTGYGKPGLNMLSDEFDYYYIAGLGLKWNLSDRGDNRNKIKSGELMLESVGLNINQFDRNIALALQNELAGINYYTSALDKDRQLIDLRNKIKENAGTRFQNGSITATEYLTESNAELFARIQYTTHSILLVQSIINYQLIKGDLEL